MASSDEKLDSDAKRAKSRSFVGYLKDRATGSADFDKSGPAKKASASVMGGANPANRAALEAAGYKKGGAVKSAPKAPPKSCW